MDSVTLATLMLLEMNTTFFVFAFCLPVCCSLICIVVWSERKSEVSDIGWDFQFCYCLISFLLSRSFIYLLSFLFSVNPKEVKINGPTEAKPGENVTLTCITSNSNPKAEIAWFKVCGRVSSSFFIPNWLIVYKSNICVFVKGGEAVDAIHTYSPPSPDGGWTTTSNVSIPVYDTDRSIIVTCQGVNKGLGESKVASHTINVIRKIPKYTFTNTENKVLLSFCKLFSKLYFFIRSNTITFYRTTWTPEDIQN